MAFWRQIFEERANQFPGIEASSAYVDAMALNLVLKPWQYDVLVTENMFGDILSDLIAAMVGGMGMAPSGDIGRSEEHTSELQSLMRISYAVFCLKKKTKTERNNKNTH